MNVKIDWDSLAFAVVPTETMYVAKAELGGEWDQGECKPYGEFMIHPAAGVLNYAQGIFEGLKAYRTKDDEIVMFRPEENAKRFARNAKRLCMPEMSVEQFLAAVKQVVLANKEYIPPFGKGSLYLRPWMAGTGPVLGVAPAPSYTTLIFATPVGSYFKSHGSASIKLEVCGDYHRAAGKGTGSYKYIGNYAGEIYYSQRAKKKGFNGCLYLDARNDEMLEEAGGANFFCVVDGKLLTPALGSILPGITRESIIRLAKEKLGLTVEERDISIKEALSATECFGSGTAASVAPIGMVHYDGKDYVFNNEEVGPVTAAIYKAITDIQLGEAEDTYGWVTKLT